MKGNVDNKQKDIDVNLAPIFLELLRRAWIIILAAIIFGGGTYALTKVLIKPSYRSSFTAYVNNQTQVVRDSLTSSDIYASQQLVLTYSKILVSDTVLMPSAEAIGLDYSYEKLIGMVSTAVEDETEIIKVHVVSHSPQVAFDLASSIAATSPAYMADIVEGSSMKIIDKPKMPTDSFAPSYFRMALIGAVVGAALASIIIIILYLRDDTIKDEKELENDFLIPVVGILPDMNLDDEAMVKYQYSYASHTGDTQQGRRFS